MRIFCRLFRIRLGGRMLCSRMNHAGRARAGRRIEAELSRGLAAGAAAMPQALIAFPAKSAIISTLTAFVRYVSRA